MPLKCKKDMAEQDIRENAMAGGTPARLRGLAANGNSISPTLEEVMNAMPVATDSTKGLMSASNMIVLRSLSFYYGVSGGTPTQYVRLGKFINSHYSPIRINLSYGIWDDTSRSTIDLVFTNGSGKIVISGKGNSLIGYVAESSDTIIYLKCTAGISFIGTIIGPIIEGRKVLAEEPTGIVYIP